MSDIQEALLQNGFQSTMTACKNCGTDLQFKLLTITTKEANAKFWEKNSQQFEVGDTWAMTDECPCGSVYCFPASVGKVEVIR